jgi:hypothetical protein
MAKKVPEFTVMIDADAMTLGDYIDLTDGGPREQVATLGKFIAVDNKLLTPEEGYKFLRDIPMSQLQNILETVTRKVIGETDPN